MFVYDVKTSKANYNKIDVHCAFAKATVIDASEKYKAEVSQCVMDAIKTATLEIEWQEGKEDLIEKL